MEGIGSVIYSGFIGDRRKQVSMLGQEGSVSNVVFIRFKK